MVEKETLQCIHDRLRAVYGNYAIDGSINGRWVQRIDTSESGEKSCIINRNRGALPQPPARHTLMHYWCRSAHHKSTIGPTAFTQQKQCNKIIEALRYLKGRTKRVCWSWSTDNKGKPSVLNCLCAVNAEREAFLFLSVTGDKAWAYHFEPEMKREWWKGINRNHQERRRSK